ncbi:hypothetical protein [Enterococcus saccharolyticus]|uniref:hypothetical protein n=1 Tax=Enterococcus saccharolyticus TaxID=41997 RepID=UPI001E351CAE|nr:hypothetical protein [Enterococcus saccharolyticus]
MGAIMLGCWEGVLIYHHQGMDKNFMFFTIPLIFCLFGLFLTTKKSWCNLERLKYYSQGIFLFHMIPIQLFNINHVENSVMNGWLRVVLGVIIPIGGVFIYRKLKGTNFYYLNKQVGEGNQGLFYYFKNKSR